MAHQKKGPAARPGQKVDPQKRPTSTKRRAGTPIVAVPDQPAQTPFEVAAAELVAAGWSVFPVVAKGKKPAGLLVRHGLKDATQKLATVAGWWRTYPTANLGATPPVGCYVLDVDVYKNHSLQAAVVDRLAPLHTPVQRSGGGGVHFVLRGDPPSESALRAIYGEGIDVKAHGKGYVLAAPSVHPDTGALYEWGKSPNLSPARTPEWLLQGAPAEQTTVGNAPPAPIENAPVAGVTIEVARELLGHLPPAMFDGYHEWLRVGFALHAQFDGSDEALALWDQASQSSPKWKEGKCAEKWQSMGHDDTTRHAYTIRSLLQTARQNGWPGLESKAVEESSNRLRLYNPLRDPPKRVDYLLGSPVWLPDLPEQVIFFGESESFKSVSVQGLCVYLAAGVSLDGKAVLPRVVVYAAEEAPMLWDNNLHAWRQHFSQTLDPSVYAHAQRNLEAGYLQRIDGNIEGLTEGRAKELADLVQRQQAALGSAARPVLVLDPVAEILDGDESKSTDMRTYIAGGRLVQRVAKAAVWHVHHTGHTETNRERGSSTLPAAMFVRYKISRPAGAYELELECKKQKARAKPMPSVWRVLRIEVMPDAEHSDPVSGVVLELIGDAAPHATQADLRAEQESADMAALVVAYRRDPRIGRPTLGRQLGHGNAKVDRLRDKAVQRGLLQVGGGTGRAHYSLTVDGRALADATIESEDDPLG